MRHRISVGLTFFCFLDQNMQRKKKVKNFMREKQQKIEGKTNKSIKVLLMNFSKQVLLRKHFRDSEGIESIVLSVWISLLELITTS